MKNLLSRTPCAFTSSVFLELVEEKSSVVFIVVCSEVYQGQQQAQMWAYFFPSPADLLVCYIHWFASLLYWFPKHVKKFFSHKRFLLEQEQRKRRMNVFFHPFQNENLCLERKGWLSSVGKVFCFICIQVLDPLWTPVPSWWPCMGHNKQHGQQRHWWLGCAGMYLCFLHSHEIFNWVTCFVISCLKLCGNRVFRCAETLWDELVKVVKGIGTGSSH